MRLTISVDLNDKKWVASEVAFGAGIIIQVATDLTHGFGLSEAAERAERVSKVPVYVTVEDDSAAPSRSDARSLHREGNP